MIRGLCGISAVEEVSEVTREALLYEAITQGEEMKAFEWVKYAVEAPRARKMVHWRAENKGEESKGGDRDGLGVICEERIDALQTDDFSAREAQGLGKHPWSSRGRKERSSSSQGGNRRNS